MTREHVIPAFMYALQKQAGDGIIGWNEVVERMVGGEAKVKDVCYDCNNRVLGGLDAYGKEVLSQSGLLVQNYLNRTLTLRYDYGLLLRWLLKVSFNSSRTDGAHSHLFEEYIPFMLGRSKLPRRSEVSAAVYLASPVLLEQSQLDQEPYRTASSGSKTFNPFLVRICYGYVQGEGSYTLRINIFGPLVFYILMFNKGTLAGHAAAAARRLLKVTPGAIELSPTRRLLELRAGTRTWVDLYENQLQRARAISGEA